MRGKRRSSSGVAHLVTTAAVSFELFSSSFCGACRQTRSVLMRAVQLLPGTTMTEHDVAREPQLAEDLSIEATPTVIVRDGRGVEVMRASGVPTVDHLLMAAARALDT